ncbi:uncharacterized protein LOC128207714 [Mya arenaria]|uniref:uncharacterized protein LOC128207714 n=1 Tax=Mya arenaria TaxID=6604 RepID=UPI0022DEAA10|nr:uncharacterized protein LOC128207714 [Mya arenaria]
MSSQKLNVMLWLFVFLTACTTPVLGKNVLVSMLDNEVRRCITDQSEPPVLNEDALVRRIMTVVQNESSFQQVMKCVELYVAITFGGFLSEHFYLFSLEDRAHIIAQAYSRLSVVSWDCLAGRLQTSACVEVPDDMAGNDVCRSAKPEARSTCARLLSQWGCPTDINIIIQQFVDIMFGKCIFDTYTQSPSPISHVATTDYTVFTTRYDRTSVAHTEHVSTEIDFNSTALLQCVRSVYGFGEDTFVYLFLPDMYTKWAIQFSSGPHNVTELNAHAMDLFCGRVVEYSACVSGQIARSKHPVDTRLRPFFNLQGLEFQFRRYCDGRSAVNQQYMCMFQWSSSCEGGSFIEMLMNMSMTPFLEDQYGQRCGAMRRSIRCRVQDVSACDQELATAMHGFLNGLLRPDCEQGANYTVPDLPTATDGDHKSNSTQGEKGGHRTAASITASVNVHLLAIASVLTVPICKILLLTASPKV